MTKITLRIDAVQAVTPDEPVQLRTPVSTVVRAEEQPVFTTQTHRPQRVFRDVIIRLRPAVACIVFQCVPLIERVRERLRQLLVP